MIRPFLYGFAQAKISGILSKSYTVESVSRLVEMSISELYSELFQSEKPDIIEYELLHIIQAKIIENNIDLYKRVLGFFSTPPFVLVHLLRRYEYQNVKKLIYAFRSETEKEPRLWDIGAFGELRLKTIERGKELETILEGTSFSWIPSLLKMENLFTVINKLDIQYYTVLRGIVSALPEKDRRGVKELVDKEILYQNITWAFRLRSFYSMTYDTAAQYLIPDKACEPFMKTIFTADFNDIQAWKDWKYFHLVDTHLGEQSFKIDPLAIEERAIQLLYRKARSVFHKYPFTLTPLYSFFKLKEFEVRLLSSVVEGIRMALPEPELLSMVGIT